MGTTLTGTTPQDTYDSLIKVTDNGPLSGTAKYLSDGLGNDSVLALSTSRVGVGTNAPSYDLTLSKSVAAGNVVLQIENTSTTGSARLWFGNNANAAGARIQYFGATHVQRPNLFSIGTDAANDVMFETSGSERMRITSAGNVGIGTSSPNGKMTIIGDTLDIRNTSGPYGTGYAIEFATNANIPRLVLVDNGEYTSQLKSTSGVATLSNASNNPITFETNNVERLRILANGGITFNGDTAAANALDDYEEGTFTPTVAGSSTTGTATYSVQSGRYTKIGNQVSVSVDLSWSGGTGTGSLRITGMPFTNVANNNAATIGFIDGISLTASNYATSYVAPSSTRLDFVQSPTGGGSVTDVSYDAAGRIIVAATYFTA